MFILHSQSEAHAHFEGAVEVFVRDTGSGFDPDAVPADRRGLAESIRARMERIGGVAAISTGPGQGTEVSLTLPREVAS